ncbi:MAG: hypothetical protein FJY77_04585, partial [Candidatus Altiarchaeales archaeon]|nr:hypothetical protein [Candidatus Altiarchaeales archaeon]
MLRPPRYPRHVYCLPRMSDVSELSLPNEPPFTASKVIPTAGIVESFKAGHMHGATNAGVLKCVELLPGHEWGVYLSKPLLLSTV